MGSAFQCDLCAYCEPGEPIVRFKIESTEVKHKSEEWCDECLASYQEWRQSRIPIVDEVTEA
jgi:hypothetical protein